MDRQKRKANVEELAEAIYEDLRTFFQERLPEERMIRIQVEPIERSVEVDDQEVDGHLVLVFHTPAGLPVRGHFLINHTGGNMYAVSAGLAEGEYKTFTLSVPDGVGVGKGDGTYTHSLETYVLNELERTTGEHILREASGESDA